MAQPVLDLVAADIGAVRRGDTGLEGALQRRVVRKHGSRGDTRRPAGADRREVTVIAPSRNEQDNLAPLVEALESALGERWSWELLLADDSDDATPDAARELSAKGFPVRLAHRRAGERVNGLSGAILHALPAVRYPTVVVMDADLQHPAASVPILAGAVGVGLADIAIGSRFCPGGAAGDGLDGPLRRLASEVSRAGTRLTLPYVRRITDPLSGFFALRRELLTETLLRPEGYKILLEVLVRSPWDTALEVPISFSPRVSGTSKFDAAEVRTFLHHLRSLRAAADVPG